MITEQKIICSLLASVLGIILKFPEAATPNENCDCVSGLVIVAQLAILLFRALMYNLSLEVREGSIDYPLRLPVNDG